METKRITSLILATLLWWHASWAQGGPPETRRDKDQFLAGALTAILEYQLHWPRGSYRLEVRNGVATITLFDDAAERKAALARAPMPEGMLGVNVMTSPEQAPEPAWPGAEIYSVLGLAPGSVPFPTGDLFLPLLADPKQPQFFVSLRRYHTPTDDALVGAVGYGETFGVYRRRGRNPGDGLQLSIAGGLFAQFNLDAPSDDLVNADYTIGLPVTWRNGDTSARLRIYHQSSHLGDEFLLRAQPERVNLSFESIEAIGSQRWGPWRVYFGGEYLFHREPSDLKPANAHGGLEYYGTRPVWKDGRLVAGLDLKSWEEHEWSVNSSFKGGLEFGAPQPGRRRLRLMAELYHGFAPHGQFYEDKLDYYGAGLYLGF